MIPRLAFVILTALAFPMLYGCGKSNGQEPLTGTTSSTENSVQGHIVDPRGSVAALRVELHPRHHLASPQDSSAPSTPSFVAFTDATGHFKIALDDSLSDTVYTLYCERGDSDSPQAMAIQDIPKSALNSSITLELQATVHLRIIGDFGTDKAWTAIPGTSKLYYSTADTLHVWMVPSPRTFLIWTERSGAEIPVDSIHWTGSAADSILNLDETPPADSNACIERLNTLQPTLDALEPFPLKDSQFVLLGVNDNSASLHTVDLCRGDYSTSPSWAPASLQRIATREDTVIIYQTTGLYEIFEAGQSQGTFGTSSNQDYRIIWSDSSFWWVTAHNASRYNVARLKKGSSQTTLSIPSSACVSQENCVLQQAFTLGDTLWVAVSGQFSKLVNDTFVSASPPAAVTATVQDIYATSNGYIWTLQDNKVQAFRYGDLAHEFVLPWTVHAFAH